MQISRYAAARTADHGLAFPDLLNTEAEEGQLQYTKLCLLSSKTNRTVLKWFEAHVQRFLIIATTIYLSHCRVLFSSGVSFQW